MSLPPLKPLHPDDRLIPLKLSQFRAWSTDQLIRSLAPGQPGALKARPDGTVMDGHHRLKILRERGVDFDGTRAAIERATQLILDICGGVAGPVVEAKADLPARPPVGFRTAGAEKVH